MSRHTWTSPLGPIAIDLDSEGALTRLTFEPSPPTTPEAPAAVATQLAEWFEAGRLSPVISSRYPLERAVDALRELADRKARGKVVVTVGEGGSSRSAARAHPPG